MRIKNNSSGETAKFLSWNLSATDQPSLVLVLLDNGSLYEWRIDRCSVVVEQTSVNVELAATTANTGSPKSLCLSCACAYSCPAQKIVQTVILACKGYDEA